MKNFTKTITNKTLFKPTRWLIMALMLLVGTSSAWGWTVYYVNSTNWSELYIHYWGGTNPSPSTWGQNPKMAQREEREEKVLGFTIYSYEIGDNTSCIFKDNKGDTNNKTGDLTSLQPDKPYYYDGKWYSIREIYENFWMFYMYQSYGGTLCLKADNNTVASNTTTQMATSGYAYVVVEKTKVDGKTLNVSNNCGDWNGTGDKKGGNEVGTEKVHPGCFYKTGSSNTIIKASTLSSLSIASSINKADANSVAITVKSTSSTSSYSNGNTNYALKAMFYVDNKYYGTSNQLSTSETSTTLDLSDLADGQHTLSVVLTDGEIYYAHSNTATFTIVSCTPPDAPELTNPAAQCGGSITLPAKDNNKITLKWYDAQTDGNVVSNTEITATGTYWAAAVVECESTNRTAYTVTINPIPEVNSLLSPLNICIGSIDETDLTTLSHVEVSSGSTAVWYTSKDGVEQAEGANLINGGTYWVAAENSTTGCKSTTRTSFTININDLPQPPSLGNYEYKTCAHASNTVDLDELASVNNVIWFQDKDEVQNPHTISIANEGTVTYTAKAVNINGCQSATGVDFTLTVNPLPTITEISGNTSAVLYEDVVLTATDVTPDAEVKWYLGDNVTPVATGTTYIVTSETAGDVIIVKAKAFLGDCESDFKEHEVTFGEEDCSNSDVTIESTKIEIWCRETGSSQAGSNLTCYAWYNDGNNHELNSDNTNKGTTTSVTKTSNIEGQEYTYRVWEFDMQNYGDYDVYVIFKKSRTAWDWQTSNLEAGKRNNRYFFTYDGSQNEQSNRGEKYSKSESLSVTTRSITAPAVKMISAEYDEENDVIVANGAVYKTGCGVTFWGFQYSKDGQTWGGKNEDYIRPISGNSLTVPGEFDYSFTIPKAGGGDIYYIRAYALNNYNNDDYNLSSAVYSTTSLPVEIPSKTIESATILLVEGEESDVTEVCPQSTVYLKVSYVGGDFKDYEAADDFPGTNLELVNHDKAKNEAIFSYTATAAGVANITISNDNTSITTTNGVSITLKNVTPVNAPMISISQGTICEDGSATITVNNPIANLTYTLYKETEPIGNLVNYQTGDLTEAGSYTVRAEESICHNYANSMPVELKVVTSDVKIGLAVDKTTVNPWQPLKLTVTPPEGYAYTIDGLADVVYTQSGDVYTIKIPRPNDWSPGNSGDPLKTMPITFSAKIQVTDDLTCGTSSVNVTLADTEENCK